MTFETLWEAERRFWLDGPDFYETTMLPHARMVFPPPVGFLGGKDIVAGLKAGPRWQSVDMEERSETESGDTAVLAYRAVGTRRDAGPYTALCASTYVRVADGWKLLFHQQTPAG